MYVNIKDIVDFYEYCPNEIGNLEAQTRYGYKTIEYAGITAYDSEIYELVLENNFCLRGSPEHQVWVNNNWMMLKDIKLGDDCFHKNGVSKVKSITKLNHREDLYDLQIEEVHEFFANEIVSHNSTLLEALSFVLFNKPFRKITKGQLVNSITNKQCVVECEFVTGSDSYKIVRGTKPNVFEIYKNNELITITADNRDYQEDLEHYILKINHKSFCQVVMLGSAIFTPFMALTKGARRELIEDLLDLKIFTSMNTLLKSKISECEQKIKDTKNTLQSLEGQIRLLVQHKKQLQQNNDDLIKQKKDQCQQLEAQIVQCQVQLEQHQLKIEQLESKKIDTTTLRNKINEYTKYQGQITLKSKQLENEISFLNNNENCPTCKQAINQQFKQSSIEEKNTHLDELKDGLVKLEEQMQAVNQQITSALELQGEIDAVYEDCSKFNTYIKTKTKQIDDINNEINNTKLSFDEQQLEALKQQYIENDTLLSNLNDDRSVMGYTATMLKDGGIKSKIIQTYVPVINQLLNKYCAALDFFVDFNLDEEFNETIRSRHRDDFTYESFSQGEKSRIDLAVLFTWRSIAKLKNSLDTNLIIFDEVLDSSMDQEGIENLMHILESLTNNENIIIISHRESVQEKFDNILQVEKKNNFSRIANDINN